LNVNKFTADGDYVKSWGSFSDAEGIAYHDGFIYIVEYSYNFDNDSYAHCFYKFNLEGDLALDEPWCGVEGSGDGEFNRPSDIAVDQTGNIFIADTQNHRIQKLSPTGEYLGQWGSVGSGEGEFNTPLHISIANSGNIYVSDWGNYRVQVFSESFNFIEEFYLFGAEEEPHFRSPRGMDFDAKGNLFVAVSGIGRVQKYSPTHDFITQLGIPPYAQGQFNIPMDIAIDSVGNVYVADTYNRRIQKFNPYGVFLTEWPIPFEGINWSYPISIAIDLDDFVYVLDQSYAQVQKYDSTGNRVVGWALEAGIIAIDVDYPLGIAVDTGGYLYVAGGYSKKIHKFTTEDGTFVTEWGGEGEIGYPVDVAVDAVGDVYLIDQNDFLVRKYDSSGTLKTAWGGDGVFPGPTSLAVDVEGYVYVLDSVAKNIHVFTAGGEFVSLWSTYILEAEEQLNSPRGITLDGNGKIFITDTFNQRIQVLAPDLPEEDPESGLILNGNFVSETREDGLSAQRVVSVNNLDFTRGAGLRTNDGLDYWAYGGTLAVDRTTETYQGVYSLRLGEPVAPVGQGLGTAWASQVFYIPPGSAAELSFNINVFTNDNINRADFIVEIQDAVALNNLAVVTQEGYQTGVEGERPDGTVELGWKTVRYDLSPFSGRVVRLVLSNRNLTQDSLGIWSYVEKVAVSTESPVGTSPNKLYLPMVLH
jgi:sugar lactone lactonase YvrE